MSEHRSEPTTILEIKNRHSGSAPTIEINRGDYASVDLTVGLVDRTRIGHPGGC
jgi:hypothetical protein